MMKLLFNCSKFQCIKPITGISTLTQMHKFHFSQQQDQEKSLEFSELSDDSTITNPILQSLSQKETFQSLSPDPSAPIRHKRLENLEWKRQNRNLFAYQKTDHVFGAIKEAKTITELYQELERFEQQVKKPKNKQTIMDILDSIAADIDSEQPKQTTDTENARPMVWKHSRDLTEAYKYAIKRCGFLKEYDEGFKIFEDIKQNKQWMLHPSIYAAVMWLYMEQDFSNESLNKCFHLFSEMQDKMNIKPSPYVYVQLIDSAVALGQYNRARELVKTLMNDKEIFNGHLTYSKALRYSLIAFYARSKQIKNGLELMHYLNKEYGLDDRIYSEMITGCALAIRAGDKPMIKPAEKLFEQSFVVLERIPDVNVFNALLHCYSAVPDIEPCIDLVKTMKTHNDWPNPNGYAFTACLRALTLHYDQPLSYEQGWKYVDEIFGMMDAKIDNKFGSMYGYLFNLCGGKFCQQSDLNKLYKYYDEMVENGVKLMPMSANSLLMAGVDHYKFELLNDPSNKEVIKEELIKYIDWALSQFKQNNLSLTRLQNEKLEQKLNEFM